MSEIVPELTFQPQELETNAEIQIYPNADVLEGNQLLINEPDI